MAGVMDIAMLLVILGGAYWVLKSGVLNTIAAPPAPVTIAPVAGETPATTPADGTTPTTTTPASTGNPLLDALNDLLGIGGSVGGANTLPTTGGGSTLPTVPIGGGPIYQGNPAECSSKYHGKCDTECASGNASLCNACQLACGGAAVGAVNVLPSQGGTNPSLCSSKYNGKCNTECENGNSSECQGCKQACGSYPAYAYYVKTPMSLMASTVFGNEHHSYYGNWGNVVVQNAR